MLKRLHPRQFNYQPRYSSQGESGKIKFTRSTLYDPHRYSKRPLGLVALVLLVAIMIYLLGGVKPRFSTPNIETNDARGRIEIQSDLESHDTK